MESHNALIICNIRIEIEGFSQLLFNILNIYLSISSNIIIIFDCIEKKFFLNKRYLNSEIW